MKRLVLLLGLLLLPALGEAANCVVGVKPARNVPCTDPSTGNTITRATDHAADQPGSGRMTNDYSLRQTFNSDQTLYMVRGDFGAWFIYRSSDHTKVFQCASPIAGDNDFTWSSTDPNKAWFMDNNGGMLLYQYNASNNTVTTIKDMTAQTQAIFGATAARLHTHDRSGPAIDGRYWAWLVEKSDFTVLGAMSYDIQTNTILGSVVGGGFDNNMIHLSPSGQYIQLGINRVMRAYKVDFSDWTEMSCWGEHDDWAINAAGDDTYVSVRLSSGGDGNARCNPDGSYYAVDVVTQWVSHTYSGITLLGLNAYTNGAFDSFHVSGRSQNHKGYVDVTTSACAYANCPSIYSDKVIILPLDGSAPTVIGSTYNNYLDYWTEAWGSISWDGKKAVWGGNWNLGGAATSDADLYIMDVPVGFTITTTTMANCTSGQACTRDVQTSGGTMPVTACVTSAGALPSGMSWSVVSPACRLSGTHTGAGTFNFTLQATDSASNNATQAFTLVYNSTLTITTTSPMPNGTIGSTYSTCFAASGGTPGYTWTKTGGSEPTGLTLGSNGCFTGTASQLGTFNTLTVQVTDSLSATASGGPYSITIQTAAPPMRTPRVIAGDTYILWVNIGAPGLPYSATCQITLKDIGGSTVASLNSTSGYASRTLLATGLTANSIYVPNYACDGTSAPIGNALIFTIPTPAAGARSVVNKLKPSALLTTAAEVKVEWGAYGGSVTDNNSTIACSSGCTPTLSLSPGLYLTRHTWQTAGHAQIVQSDTRYLQVQ